MAKTKISEFDVDPSNNTDINSINIAEGCAPSGINNAIRQLMSDLKEQQTGASGDNFTVGGNLAVTGTSTFTGATTFNGAVVFSSTVTGLGLGTMSTQNKGAVDIEGGTIDATPIGASTASTVRGTTITATTGFVGNLTGNASTATSATSATSASSATTAGFANNGVKAWAIYSTSSGLVRGYNISSVSASSLSWTFNFSSGMSNSNYGISLTHSPTNGADIYNRPLNVNSWNSSSLTVTSPGGGTPAYIWITVFDY